MAHSEADVAALEAPINALKNGILQLAAADRSEDAQRLCTKYQDGAVRIAENLRDVFKAECGPLESVSPVDLEEAISRASTAEQPKRLDEVCSVRQVDGTFF